jgi:formylglycine-generating enzyme required for sulfatase activity
MLNERGDGYRYRLPTKEEWLLASGNPIDNSSFGWVGEKKSTNPVKSLNPQNNLYDMFGNVWEMTSSSFSTSENQNLNVIMGEAFDSGFPQNKNPNTKPSNANVDTKSSNETGASLNSHGYSNVGFRLVRTPIKN